MKKKSIDAIQDAIITENVLAVMGVVTPIVTSFACMWTGINTFDLVGQMINGNIQIYLGYLIIKSNLSILAGKSIKDQDKNAIIKNLMTMKEISKIVDFKSEFRGDESVKVFLKIKHNRRYIAENLILQYKQDILSITQDPEKIEKIEKLLMESAINFDDIIDISIIRIEQDIFKEYPNADHIDLELSSSNIIKGYESKEK
jgi:Co/Zn/Cd efflux system component